MKATYTIVPTPEGVRDWSRRTGHALRAIALEAGCDPRQLYRWIYRGCDLSERNGRRLLAAMRRLESSERYRAWRSGSYPAVTTGVAEADSVLLEEAPQWLRDAGYPTRGRETLREAVWCGKLPALSLQIGASVVRTWIRPADLVEYVKRTEPQRQKILATKERKRREREQQKGQTDDATGGTDGTDRRP